MFCITAARLLHVSLTSENTEKTEKANGLQSIKIDRRWVYKKELYSLLFLPNGTQYLLTNYSQGGRVQHDFSLKLNS